MSILSDKGLMELQKKHSDFIQPFNSLYLQPSSIDLHFRLNKGVICPPLADETDVVENFSRIVLPPSELVLISTLEKIHIPNGYVGRVEGVSSLARIGLLVHITSGFIDPNFKGHITLEVVNLNRYPIVLEDGARICQLVVEKLDSPNKREYSSKSNHYQDQDKTTPSKYEKDFRASHYIIRTEKM
ncbi:MAG: dCTP deaminase [Paludibacteraceae bacterium]|nr:dCTP deaminase [Paludibacteraceae bacterium]